MLAVVAFQKTAYSKLSRAPPLSISGDLWRLCYACYLWPGSLSCVLSSPAKLAFRIHQVCGFFQSEAFARAKRGGGGGDYWLMSEVQVQAMGAAALVSSALMAPGRPGERHWRDYCTSFNCGAGLKSPAAEYVPISLTRWRCLAGA